MNNQNKLTKEELIIEVSELKGKISELECKLEDLENKIKKEIHPNL